MVRAAAARRHQAATRSVVEKLHGIFITTTTVIPIALSLAQASGAVERRRLAKDLR